ncbi:MAG TPA: flagellar hook-associated protein FlgK [Bryobacteraceae bacterium]|nr:flagellar hook-associated protein FlgK [Bryobacteraceae bacterium]
MSSLLSTILTSAGALKAYDQVFQVSQNNVANAQTPGYAKQQQPLEALPFDPATGLSGGVWAGQVQSARDEFAEQAVRRQTVAYGQYQQQVNSLNSLQSVFDISGNSGISKSLNDFFQAFSGWSTTPNDSVARQTVLDRATDLAQSFQQTSAALDQVTEDTETQIQQTVDQVNGLVSQLQGLNVQIRQGDRNDAGLDAQMHSTLEQLSQLVNVSAIQQQDGSFTVLLNGQTALLVGSNQYKISFDLKQPTDPPPVNPGGPANAQIVAADGSDVTAQTTTGQLGALLDMRNRLLPTYIGDAYQPGDINQMAKQFADRVNQLLTSGNISDGPPPQPGVPLFTYDSTNNTTVAQTLAVNPAITADQLAAISPGPPYVSNGVALQLSQMANPQNTADEIDNFSYTEFYGQMATRVGSELNTAQSGLQGQQQMVAQAQNLRQQVSGVSLDEEAATLIEFQRAYQANSRFITVLDQLTEDTLNILQ